jgi:hypothetical protein
MPLGFIVGSRSPAKWRAGEIVDSEHYADSNQLKDKHEQIYVGRTSDDYAFNGRLQQQSSRCPRAGR